MMTRRQVELTLDTGEGSVTRTGRKRVCPVESDADYNQSWENKVEARMEIEKFRRSNLSRQVWRYLTSASRRVRTPLSTSNSHSRSRWRLPEP